MNPFSTQRKILLIGQVFVDRHLDHENLRLGGVFHCVRALQNTGIEYSVAYFCPEYLNEDCEKYFLKLGCSRQSKIGNIVGAPNVIDIGDSKEAGSQRYVDILRDRRSISLDKGALQDLLGACSATDALIIGSEFPKDVFQSLAEANLRLHMDVDHIDPQISIESLSTVFGSTSGDSFRECGAEAQSFFSYWRTKCSGEIVLKENRGGSRAWFDQSGSYVEAPAFPISTTHSVGVGDCFNAVFVSLDAAIEIGRRLRFSSYIASLYASTFDQAAFSNDLTDACAIFDEVTAMHGTRVPWESRPALQIYLAAPDFPWVDTSAIDSVEQALLYHNFRPVRPIRENGLGTSHMSSKELRAIYAKDVELLESASLLVAIAINDDPGTFAELGWFAHKGLPTILFDPHGRTKNLFVRNLASVVAFTLAELVDAMFDLVGRKS